MTPHQKSLSDKLTNLQRLTSPDCWCMECDLSKNHGLRSRMSLCPDCGNKRCPKATHHDNPCSGSNEPEQKGSAYE